MDSNRIPTQEELDRLTERLYLPPIFRPPQSYPFPLDYIAVGGIVEDSERGEDGARIIHSFKLTEMSFVSAPVNPHCVVIRLTRWQRFKQAVLSYARSLLKLVTRRRT